MKPMKLAEVREHTGRELTVEEAARYVSPSQSDTVTRNQACALSLHSWLNSATDWLGLETRLVLHPPRLSWMVCPKCGPRFGTVGTSSAPSHMPGTCPSSMPTSVTPKPSSGA